MKEELIDVIIETSTEAVTERAADRNLHPAKNFFDVVQINHGCKVGALIGFAETGEPLVQLTDEKTTSIVRARTTQQLTDEHVGKEVTLIFENGDIQKPVVVGVIQKLEQTPKNGKAQEQNPVDIKIDGEKLMFTAQKEIVLKCGKASITLTRAGKVLIRGTYLLNRSSGVNRIKGGSVQIN